VVVFPFEPVIPTTFSLPFDLSSAANQEAKTPSASSLFFTTD
jgi:hypothetical protein